MLINKDIVPPVLYDTYYDRGIIDEKSMEYLVKSNPQPLREYIKQQIAKVQLMSDVDDMVKEKSINKSEERA